MSDKTEKSTKLVSKNIVLISALVWFGLGLFGLIFDPTKNVIIISQLVLGLSFLIYYFRLKSKK